MVVKVMKKNKKPSASKAWKMLLLSLPKGIAVFVTVVAGLSVSLPLSVFLIGLPLLAETLVLCGRMMASERVKAESWSKGEASLQAADRASDPSQQTWKGWRALLAVLGKGRSYRGLLYGLLQLPIGIAAFTLAIVLPVTAWAVLLSPLAYQISIRMYDFNLFAADSVPWMWLPDLSPFERSWVAAGVGAVLVLLMPAILRALGRLYAAAVRAIAGPEDRSAAADSIETHAGDADDARPNASIYAS